MLRNAIISGLVSLVITPILTWLTLNVTAIVQAPDLSIVSMETSAIAAPSPIPDKLAGRYAPLSGILLTAAANRGIDPYGPCFSSLRTGQLVYNCITLFNSMIDIDIPTLIDENSVIQQSIKIGKITPAMNFMAAHSIYSNFIYNQMVWDDTDSPEIVLGRYHDNVDSAIDYLKDLREYLKSLSEKGPSRTGKVIINTGILNRGGTDSVVFANGNLKFSGQSLALQPHTNPNNTTLVIRARSVINIPLTINEEASSGGALRDWTKIVQQRINQPFTISLKSFDNMEVTSTGILPVNDTYEQPPNIFPPVYQTPH